MQLLRCAARILIAPPVLAPPEGMSRSKDDVIENPEGTPVFKREREGEREKEREEMR